MNLPRWRGIPFDHVTRIQVVFAFFYVGFLFYGSFSTYSFLLGIDVLPNIIPHILPWNCFSEFFYDGLVKTESIFGYYSSERAILNLLLDPDKCGLNNQFLDYLMVEKDNWDMWKP